MVHKVLVPHMRIASLPAYILLVFHLHGYDQASSLAKEVLRWNEAINNQTSSYFLLNYDRATIYYTDTVSPEKIYSLKVEYITNRENYGQDIISDLEIIEYPDNRFLCRFQKRVYQDGRELDFPSYLVFDLSRKPKIIEEGDEVTNMNKGYVINYGNELSHEIVELKPIMNALGIESVRGMQSELTLKSFWKNTKLILLILGTITAIVLLLRVLQNVVYGVAYAVGFIQGLWEHIFSNQEYTRFDEVQIKKDFEPQEKGRAFENYTQNLFDSMYYTQLDKRSDNQHRGRFAASSSYPDFEYRYEFKGSYAVFAVESKYRSKLYQDGVLLCKNYTFKKYKEFRENKKMKVFIFIGMYGDPNDPDELYLVDLDELQSPMIKVTELQKYKQPKGEFFWDSTTSKLVLWAKKRQGQKTDY